MKKPGSLKININKLSSRVRSVVAVVVVGGLSVIGFQLFIAGHAESPYSSSFAADGSLSGTASVVIGGSNSDGDAVEFGVPQVSVSLGTNTHSFNADFLGFNTSDEGLGNASNWGTDPFVSDVAALGAQNYRIYGGTWSDYINWQTGQYFDTFGTTEPVSGSSTTSVPGSSFTLANYIPFIKGTNSAALFNINIMTYCPASDPYPEGANDTCGQPLPANVSDYTTGTKNYSDSTTSGTCLDPVADSSAYDSWGLAYQVEMLKTAQSDGIPIKYVELGNELYDYGTDDDQFFPCPQDYVNKANYWIQTLDQDFPGVQVAVIGEDSSYTGTTSDCLLANRSKADCTRLELWNQALFDSSNVLDPSSTSIVNIAGENAVTFHTYYHSELGVDASVDDPSDLAAMLSTGAQDRYITTQADLALLPTGTKAWITEWNIDGDPTDLVYGSWAQGLSEATYAIALASNSQVDITDVHDLADSGQVWGALFSGTSYTTFGGIATVPSPVPATQQYGMTSGGFALSDLLRTMHDATSTTDLSFGSNPDISGTAVQGLLGQSFLVDGKTNLYIINLSADNETINLGALAGNYSVLQYSTSPSNFTTGTIPTTTSSATTQVTIPPYSVSSLVSTLSN